MPSWPPALPARPGAPRWDPSERPPTDFGASAVPSALPAGVKKLVAIGGGRGGAGHSVLSVNLGVYLAQLGRKVVLLDADPTCPALHSMLDVEVPTDVGDPDALDEEDLTPLGTHIQGLTFIPQKYSRSSTAPLRPGRKPRWTRQLQNLDADYILIDLGAGTSPAALDVFAGADLGICVTTPDPPAVEGTYRFLRGLFQRKLRRLYMKDRHRARIVERAQKELPPLPSPLAVLRELARYDRSIADMAASELASISAYFVASTTKMRQEVELSRSMADMAGRYLGIYAEDLGHVEQDDAISLSVVRRRPLLLDNPSSKSGRNIERIARRMVAVLTSRAARGPRPTTSLKGDPPSLYDVLWTQPSASDEELRRAYKRQRELFQSGSLPLASLLSEAETEFERLRLEEAQKTLLDAVRRRAYDLSYFPEKEARPAGPSPAQSEARRLEQAALRAELAHELHAETEFTGELFRRVRESQGIELEDIAQKTKISLAHLAAIEDEDFGSLPAEVYTRGFVNQVAGLLGLDKTQATRSYLRRFRARKKAAALERP